MISIQSYFETWGTEVLKTCSIGPGQKTSASHDLRHTFASWRMMNSGDPYELAKILGHFSIKIPEHYETLARKHIARTSGTARELWKILEPQLRERRERWLTNVRVLFARGNLNVFGYL